MQKYGPICFKLLHTGGFFLAYCYDSLLPVYTYYLLVFHRASKSQPGFSYFTDPLFFLFFLNHFRTPTVLGLAQVFLGFFCSHWTELLWLHKKPRAFRHWEPWEGRRAELGHCHNHSQCCWRASNHAQLTANVGSLSVWSLCLQELNNQVMVAEKWLE